MEIYVIKGEQNLSNMYLIKGENQEAILFDVSDYSRVRNIIQENKLKIKYVILSHGHFDHISGLNQLRQENDCKVISTNSCSKVLGNPRKNLSRYKRIIWPDATDGLEVVCKEADITFESEMKIYWSKHEILIFQTKGHSDDSCCMMIEESLFSGDTILNNLYDIFRIPGADRDEFYRTTFLALKKIMQLHPKMIVYPGHGEIMKLTNAIKCL